MSEPLKLGIAGLGTVGIGVLNVLGDNADVLSRRCNRPLRVTAVSARDRKRDRGVDFGDCKWFDDCVELARSPDIDIFVELIGGEDGPAKQAVEAALAAGHHVVTANKALLAAHGTELARLAEANGAALNYEAAIAGGIPIVKTMRESFAGNRAQMIYGILNGCTAFFKTAQIAEIESDLVLRKGKGRIAVDGLPVILIGLFETTHFRE